ncbi:MULTISPECIES: DUF6445 family protein [Kordiimonas]|uniref:DUF6445 family protein n=1 Tax=Kordiimonas TaxID=288021 RepID=UPI001FF50B21|nr:MULTISPECIES: DUF6445 family protein [Kordiimonas]MCK0070252.1 DUF6445 family protein [Kordiimonas laminariae]UTW58983.1 hypothetical protein KFE96_01355 [Kordiimonas sp. SCSIO 12603]
MKQSLIIIDDFLPDPFVLRNAALQQEYPTYDTPTMFAGRNSQYRQKINGFDEKIAEIVGEPLALVPGSSYHKFRIALDGENGTHSVHIDPAHWTVILYLTLPEHCEDGTHLYQHRPTGLDHTPWSKKEWQESKWDTQDQVWSDIIEPDTNDMDKWEKTMTVPMRFNRLMIFRPQQFHDAGRSFGTSLENGRLIYLSSYTSVNGFPDK